MPLFHPCLYSQWLTRPSTRNRHSSDGKSGRSVEPGPGARHGSARRGAPRGTGAAAEACVARVAVLGAGAWGTSLALHLASHGYDTRLWARRPDFVQELAASRRNPLLPEVELPASVAVSHEASAALEGV